MSVVAETASFWLHTMQPDSGETSSVPSLQDVIEVYTRVCTAVWDAGAHRSQPKDCQPENMEGKQEQDDCERDYLELDDLPEPVKLHVLSFLDVKSVCQLAAASRDWRVLGNDNILWRKLLERDGPSWSSIGHRGGTDLSKEDHKWRYLQCCPEAQRHKEASSIGSQLRGYLRLLLPKTLPMVAMFGPGLNTSTSQIVRAIISGKEGVFKTNMQSTMWQTKLPRRGGGGGLAIKFRNKQDFFLITLYSGTRSERESQSSGNKLLVPKTPTSTDAEPEYELKRTFRRLCSEVAGFIFVVDASQGIDHVESGLAELQAMTDQRWTPESTPVLVLSCVPGEGEGHQGETRLPCIKVMEALQLGSMSRPWQVQNAVAGSLQDVDTGVEWLMNNIQGT
ncbi:PREDICTED: F-box only protein 4-like [Branchiostoma belcheri]|uniref:F-box only protein 4-like n=1 Tax=Branchiostoma belcheri TaxID=7741 RepID=A0A6P4ZSA3_BRABE|nr:PREDICTED: F-box only protein 4-like [Branchiostoma belcheri]